MGYFSLLSFPMLAFPKYNMRKMFLLIDYMYLQIMYIFSFIQKMYIGSVLLIFLVFVLFYYVSLLSEFRVVMSVTISA